jgi:hypothetical protein
MQAYSSYIWVSGEPPTAQVSTYDFENRMRLADGEQKANIATLDFSY